jgi:hypothetical protein
LRRSSVAGRLSIQPGSTLFMRTLCGAYCSAKILVKAASPARNTAEVGNIGLGSKVQAVEMLTMAPPFCCAMIGAARRVGRITFIR